MKVVPAGTAFSPPFALNATVKLTVPLAFSPLFALPVASNSTDDSSSYLIEIFVLIRLQYNQGNECID